MMMTTAITKICANFPNKTLCEFEMSRRPHAVRRIVAKYNNEDFTYIKEDLKFDESAYAKMESKRRPWATARMNKLKK